ncbi:MAG: hypothetical protein II126_04540 [Erysipelotrichaceae bacterium]|nr:hypothetical protein [Erysipelotrichaceae bacterium]
MRDFLIRTMTLVLCAMTVFDAGSIFMMFRQYRESGKSVVPLLTGVICIGLFYDSLILALGGFMDFGNLLKTLSQLRYILHFVLIPLLFPLCAYALTNNRKIINGIWVLTAMLMAVGAVAGVKMITEPIALGVNRYAQAAETAGWVNGLIQMLNIVPDFVIIGIGIYLMIRKKNPHLFLSGFMMLAFTMIGIFLGKDPSGDKSKSLMFYISMYGESLMVYFLYRYMKKEAE